MKITERILQFIEKENISKYKFYKITGFSNGFLDKNSNIGSDKCEIIISHFPKLNIEWLIAGKEPMLKTENIAIDIGSVVNEPAATYNKNVYCKKCTEKDYKIKILEDNIFTKDKLIALLEHEIDRINNPVEIDKKKSA